MGSGEIVFIEGEEEGRFPHAHCLFIDDEVAAVIDPADRPETLKRLQSEKDVGVVLNSHSHVDHIRYNYLFPDANIMAHRLDAPSIESLDEAARHVGVDSLPLVEAWKVGMRNYYGYRESKVSRHLEDGDLIELGSNTVKVVHTPGHTSGHCCFQFLEKRAVYLADVDLTGFGPWYGNLSSDVDAFIASVDRLKKLDVDVYYSAHGRGGVYRGDISDLFDSYIGVIYEREGRILDFLSREREFDEVVRQLFIYRKKWEPEQMLYFLEGIMVRKHLERLERLGKVKSGDGRWKRA